MRALLFTLPLLAFSCGAPSPAPDGGSVDAGCRDLSKTPANLLENPSFECDSSPAEWSAVYGTLELAAPGRSGRAAKVTVNQAGGRFAYTKEFAPNPGTRSFCFTAWLSGTAPYMRMRVLRVDNGGVREITFSEKITSTWERFPPVNPLLVPSENASKLQLVFEVQTNRGDGLNGMPGDTMLIDDVDVWETSGTCAETR